MSLSAIDFVGFLAPDDPRWPAALAGRPHDLFHLPGYLEACAEHSGGEPVLFLLEAGPHGMLVPLIKRSLEAFGEPFKNHCDAASPYGYPGPLYWGPQVHDHLVELHGHCDAFLRAQKIVSLFLRLNPFIEPTGEQLAAVGTVVPHGSTIYMDLRDAEASWHGINPSNRTFISRMLRNGSQVRFDEWDKLDIIVRAYHETMTRLEAKPSYFFARAFFERLRDRGTPHFHLAIAYDSDNYITGGVFFSEVNGLIQYFLTGTFGEFAPQSPGKVLINALRLWGLERGAHTLHLGGGLGAATDNLFEFKRRFSHSCKTFSTFRKVLLPEVYRDLAGGLEAEDVAFFPSYRG